MEGVWPDPAYNVCELIVLKTDSDTLAKNIDEAVWEWERSGYVDQRGELVRNFEEHFISLFGQVREFERPRKSKKFRHIPEL